jgi:hypothetical protein
MGRSHDDADFEAFVDSDDGAGISLHDLRAIRSCALHHEIHVSPAMYRALRDVLAGGQDADTARRDEARAPSL